MRVSLSLAYKLNYGTGHLTTKKKHFQLGPQSFSYLLCLTQKNRFPTFAVQAALWNRKEPRLEPREWKVVLASDQVHQSLH